MSLETLPRGLELLDKDFGLVANHVARTLVWKPVTFSAVTGLELVPTKNIAPKRWLLHLLAPKSPRRGSNAKAGSTIEISASDLSQFLGCRHRTGLDLAVARGILTAPTWVDPIVTTLQQRGLEHEQAYADSLRAQGLKVVDLADLSGDKAYRRRLKLFGRGRT